MFSLMEHIAKFQSEEDCWNHLIKIRWPKGPVCPKCKTRDAWVVKTRSLFTCKGCRHQFSPTVGTIMEDSHLPLTKWFLAIHLMLQSKKGISAKQLERELRVSYKTAWYLCHRIREAMKNDNFSKLCGIIEIDDTYVGSPAKNPSGPKKRGRGTNRSPAIAIRERGEDGRVRTAAVENLSGANITDFVVSNADLKGAVFHTDEFKGYLALKGLAPHFSVDHSRTYVHGDIHCNSVESFWSLLKRGVIGTFHKVSVKHLERYLTEFEFRFNHRKNDSIFERVLSNGEGKLLRYHQLINGKEKN